MHIEIRDPSLVERLRRLLPRPDAPFDDVILKLLEQPCKLRTREVVEEVLSALNLEERITLAVEQALAKFLTDVDRRVAHNVEKVVRDALRHLPIGEFVGGGWDAVIREAKRRPDGCLSFAEIRKYYGKNLNSIMLRKKGFVQRERGLWCLPKED
ncbi:MAG: hypothetical protein ABWK05_03175 [Pyrobaculum sp.]